MNTKQKVVFGAKRDFLKNKPNILKFKYNFDSIYFIEIKTNTNRRIEIQNTNDKYSMNPLKSIASWISLANLAVHEALYNRLDNILIELPSSIWLDLVELCHNLKKEMDYLLKDLKLLDFSIYFAIPKEYKTSYQEQKQQRSTFYSEDKILQLTSYINTFPALKQKIIDILHETNNYDDRNHIIEKTIFSKMNDPYYVPEKHTIINVIVECELDIEEANELLNIAGYYLSTHNEYDQIIRDGIEKKKSADDINSELLKRKVKIRKNKPIYTIFPYQDKLLGVGKEKKCVLLENLKGVASEKDFSIYKKKWGC
jgi:hypothetical protein